jgi:HAD superfamily hydrolase (TIGR01509 family)
VRDFLLSRGRDPEPAIVHALGERKQALVERALEADGVEPYPGSVAWVEHLRAHDVRTAVVSSSANAGAVLAAVGIDEHFDAIVDGGEAKRLELAGKPAPDGFLEGARRLSVAPRRAVVVEDALAGVAAGRAGLFGLVIGVARGVAPSDLYRAGADVVVADLEELVP